MMKIFISTVLCPLLLTLFCIVQSNVPETTKKYVVQVHNVQKPSVFVDVDGWYRARLDTATQNSRNIFHIYRTVFHGYATELTEQEVELIKTRPEVLAIYPTESLELHTTRTPEFLGLVQNEGNVGRLLRESDSGSNVVIGVLDSGIWPERASFNDHGLGPIPTHWNGQCVIGQHITNVLCNHGQCVIGQHLRNVHCNKKLVGVRVFHSESNLGLYSARDSTGHGTHVSSIAAGCVVSNVSLFGYASGVASGIAPKARIAIYKVCGPEKFCNTADVIAAYDKAIEDGVDIISFSLGSTKMVHYHEDPIAIAQFGAMENNVFSSTSAGNQGPSGVLSNISPWVTTVGAGTMDRKFPAELILENGSVLSGESIYSGPPLPKKAIFPLVYLEHLSKSGAWDPRAVTGKIVVSKEWIEWPREVEVKNAGGIGLVIAEVGAQGGDLLIDAHVLPTITITKTAFEHVMSYLTSSKTPQGTIISRGTELNVKPAPLVAHFSSRGPNTESKYIIKPDLIAPGVNILATWPDDLGPTGSASDTRRTEFSILSGTSMSCPHISGVAALLKGAHPDWSPSRIKSAMMTTSYVVDNVGNHLLDGATYEIATAWDYGSGHVDPEKALDPGLVYDLTVDDYIDFLCASNYTEQEIKRITRRSIICKKGLQPWDLNYPSISVAFDQSNEIFVTRTATQVSEGPSSYIVKIENPIGVTLTVDPPRLDFTAKNQKLSYKIKIVAENVQLPRGKSKTKFGRIRWQDGEHVVQMPIAVTLSGCYNHFSLFNSTTLSLLTLTLLVLFI